jgi:hypothetical protein
MLFPPVRSSADGGNTILTLVYIDAPYKSIPKMAVREGESPSSGMEPGEGAYIRFGQV